MAVFIVFACLAFMGIAAAVTIAGRPNWDGEEDKLAGDFIFEAPSEGNPSWKVTSRQKPGVEDFSKSSKVHADVVLAARAHLITQQEKKIERLDEEIPQLESRLTKARELIEIDVKAMQQREDELEVQIDALVVSIKQVGEEGIKVTQDAQKVRVEAELRRQDVFRLRDQLQELQTDLYQIREQKKKLHDYLVQMNGVLARLQRRNAQLKKTTPKSNDYDSDSGAVQ